MNEKRKPITEADLHAYADNLLDPKRRQEVEQYLEQHSEAAEQVRAYQEINTGLHQLFDHVLEEPIPSRLKQKSKTSHSSKPLQIAAMLATLAIGTAIGWLGRGEWNIGQQPIAQMVDHAFTAHVVYTPEVKHPVEVGANEEKHLVNWLTKRLDAPVKAPQLNTLGYELLGGRLLAAEGKPAAQFMYQNGLGNRLTLFIRKNPNGQRDTAFRFANNDSVRGFYWIDGELGYALIGETERTTIAKAAHLVYEQLAQ
ncbi:MAG: anti-sigma factor [Chromatiales bacterium]|nr:anti-sigma factor [Chromatiales bacterium]